jgi:hypothetical protein
LLHLVHSSVGHSRGARNSDVTLLKNWLEHRPNGSYGNPRSLAMIEKDGQVARGSRSGEAFPRAGAERQWRFRC